MISSSHKIRKAIIGISILSFFFIVWVIWETKSIPPPVSIRYDDCIDYSPVNTFAGTSTQTAKLTLLFEISNKAQGRIKLFGPPLIEWKTARINPSMGSRIVPEETLASAAPTIINIPASGAISTGGEWRLLVPIADYGFLGDFFDRKFPVVTRSRLFSSLLKNSVQWAASPWYPEISLPSEEMRAQVVRHNDALAGFMQAKISEWTGAEIGPPKTPLNVGFEWFELPVSDEEGLAGVGIMTKLSGNELENWMTDWLGIPDQSQLSQSPLRWTKNLHGVTITLDRANSPSNIFIVRDGKNIKPGYKMVFGKTAWSW
jgi:hypothetical protein